MGGEKKKGKRGGEKKKRRKEEPQRRQREGADILGKEHAVIVAENCLQGQAEIRRSFLFRIIAGNGFDSSYRFVDEFPKRSDQNRKSDERDF